MNSIGYALGFVPGLLCPMLLAIAVGVRAAGQNRALNAVDYKAIDDVPGFHKTLGNRLMWLPGCAAGAAAACFEWPALAILWLTLFFLSAILVSIFAIASSSSVYAKYRRPKSRSRAQGTLPPSRLH